MSYAVKQDMIEQYGEAELIRLTDRTNTPQTTIDDAIVQNALDSADGMINGYLQAAGITVPIAPVPRSVVDAARTIARYRLWKDKASAQVRQDYEDAIAWLVNVAKGIVQLGDNAAPAPAVSAGSPKSSAPCRTFTKDTLRNL
jgi:phage gp36-like protein